MKRSLIRHGILLLAASGTLGANPEAQPQVSFTEGANGTWKADWIGVSARTYFLQWSLDLANWSYAPLVEYGTGMKSFGINTQGERKFFIRLHYVDDTPVTTLQQARDADFDSDGISNAFEVEETGSNPFDSASVGIDTDQDGMPDWWEILYGLDPDDPADANGDLVGDGVTNLVKYKTGRNPQVVALTDTTGALALKVHTPLE